MRSSAFSRVAIEQAKDSRTCPGAPKAEPGTTATSASVIRRSTNAVSSAMPSRAIACSAFANA